MGNSSGESKKDFPVTSSTPAPTKKTREVPAGSCSAVGCRAHSDRFSFCHEHYEQFKFGLIKKTGEQVPDYEKKFEHYAAYKVKHGVKKVA